MVVYFILCLVLLVFGLYMVITGVVQKLKGGNDERRT